MIVLFFRLIPPLSITKKKQPIMKTVLITGCSSGYGLETARHFHAKGWDVIATMRTPREDILLRSERLRVLALDVTSPASIERAIDAAGPIDVLVNNAGIGLVGAFEATQMPHVRKLFETNTFGIMAMTQSFHAAYTASKQAIEGFTGSLAHELGHFGIRVKLVEPGYAPTTRFSQNTDVRVEDLIPDSYAAFAEPIFAGFAHPPLVTTEADVADGVWQAANDCSGQLRFPAGPDAVALARAN